MSVSTVWCWMGAAGMGAYVGGHVADYRDEERLLAGVKRERGGHCVVSEIGGADEVVVVRVVCSGRSSGLELKGLFMFAASLAACEGAHMRWLTSLNASLPVVCEAAFPSLPAACKASFPSLPKPV